jgi:asparagine synthase (glutamine-hydrolysing)
MCGIAGTIRFDAKSIKPDDVARMSGALQHRGPDDHGYLGWSRGRRMPVTSRNVDDIVGSTIALAHRRLSILDLSNAGWQPMSTRDGFYHIVFNGEIYNYLELRNELSRAGVVFESTSDTEVLLKGLIHWGLPVLLRLVGMFAFCFVDLRDGKLVLARDFFGVKPLYYSIDRNRMHFASELQALLTQSDVERTIDPAAVYDYLQRGTIDASEQSLIHSIRRVKPGHYVEIPINCGSDAHSTSYWKPPSGPSIDISIEEASNHLRSLFIESVGLHLRSDVPVATTLSGGIDSSAIAMVMREICGQSLEIHSFSYIADDPRISEEKWVDLVSSSAGVITHKVKPTPAEFADDLDGYLQVTDEPIGSYSGYAHYRVFQMVKEMGIKVSLDGQGADEQLCGYGLFLDARRRSMQRSGKWLQAWRFLAHQCGNGEAAPWRITAKRAARYLARECFPWIRSRHYSIDMMDRCLNHEWFQDRGVDVITKSSTSNCNGVHELLVDSFTQSSLPRLLRTGDRHSMAHSVESRVPFLTPSIVEFCMALPEEFLVDGQATRKAVFRRCMRGIVPDAVLNRRDKVAFQVPNWLKPERSRFRTVLSSSRDLLTPLLDVERVSKLWHMHERSNDSGIGPVWRILNYALWAQRYGVNSS